MTVHKFRQSLALSHEHEDAEWWPEIYGRAFPEYLSAVSVRNDGWAQRGGIDRVITLKSGKTVTVDEKVRAESYPDIILEQWSNLERRSPGWMQKELACDFIAYAFIPDRTCYLLPFHNLRRAWLKNGREWIANAKERRSGFRIVDAQNENYVTRSIAVPTPVLMDALIESHVIQWGAA